MITVKQGPNPERIELWAKALESGKYAKATGTLRRVKPPDLSRPEFKNEHPQSIKEWSTIGYCCLGVACEVAIENGLVLEREVDDMGVHGVVERFRTPGGDEDDENAWQSSFLPGPVVRWFGLDSMSPVVTYMVLDPFEAEPDQETVISLATLNDNSDRTFPEIAAIVRENFLPKKVTV